MQKLTELLNTPLPDTPGYEAALAGLDRLDGKNEWQSNALQVDDHLFAASTSIYFRLGPFEEFQSVLRSTMGPATYGRFGLFF